MPVKEYQETIAGATATTDGSSYGSTEGLKQLMMSVMLGIRVIMDGIFNHSEAESPDANR